MSRIEKYKRKKKSTTTIRTKHQTWTNNKTAVILKLNDEWKRRRKKKLTKTERKAAVEWKKKTYNTKLAQALTIYNILISTWHKSVCVVRTVCWSVSLDVTNNENQNYVFAECVMTVKRAQKKNKKLKHSRHHARKSVLFTHTRNILIGQPIVDVVVAFFLGKFSTCLWLVSMWCDTKTAWKKKTTN